MLGGKDERRAIAGRQQLVLALGLLAPDRTDRVDDMPGLEPVAARDLRGSGLAAAERAAFRQQLRARGAMDRAVDPAAAPQRAVRRIDDGVDVERGDAGDADFELRRAD